MKTLQMELDKGFYAVMFSGAGTATLYYSYGKLIAVQAQGVLWVSENYWLGESSKHVAYLQGQRSPHLSVMQVALDVLEFKMFTVMREVFI